MILRRNTSYVYADVNEINVRTDAGNGDVMDMIMIHDACILSRGSTRQKAQHRLTVSVILFRKPLSSLLSNLVSMDTSLEFTKTRGL